MLLGLRNVSDKEGSSVFPSHPWLPYSRAMEPLSSAYQGGRLQGSTPCTPRARGSCGHTHLLQGLSDFAFITQLQLGDGQDGLNSLQLSVYVMNEFGGEALFYHGQVLGYFQRQEKDDAHAAGQGQLGNLQQQRRSTGVSALDPKSPGLDTHSRMPSPLLFGSLAMPSPAPNLFNNCPSRPLLSGSKISTLVPSKE